MLVRGVLFVLTPYVSWEFAQRWPGESALYGAPGGEVVRLAGLRQCKAFNGCNNFFLLSPPRGRRLVPQGYWGGGFFYFFILTITLTPHLALLPSPFPSSFYSPLLPSSSPFLTSSSPHLLLNSILSLHLLLLSLLHLFICSCPLDCRSRG